MVEAEAEVEAEAVNFKICHLEAGAEVVKKSTASASLVKMSPKAVDGVK